MRTAESAVLLLVATLICALIVVECQQQVAEPQQQVEPPKQRAKELLAKMNLEEKITLVHGVNNGGWGTKGYIGETAKIPRLSIPAINMEDSPQGVADGVLNVTCFPSALTAVATWDRTLMYQYAQAVAEEQKIKGTIVVLGPMVNIARVPMGGRTFESFGEDPHLAAQLVVPYVKGVQDKGLLACVKHFANNNQEVYRLTTSANVELRTQWEIYYPAFEAAVEAGVGSVMCAYNLVNGTYACENDEILNRDLKGKMKFEGFVVSDWGATHSTVKAANSGLDMEMPDFKFFGKRLADEVKQGHVSMDRLNDMVLRILTPMFAVGIFDREPSGNLSANAQSPERTLLARKVAAEGTVLLKNEKNILPLKSTKFPRVAIIGDDAHDKPMMAGGGSGYVNTSTSIVITPLQALRKQLTSSHVSYVNSSNIDAAVALAKDATLAIVFVSVFSSEGMDRPSMSLTDNQDALVDAVASANPTTIVVYHGPSASLFPWANKVLAIVCGFYPGQEIGPAVADILMGTVNPAGRLPITFPMRQEETCVNTRKQYPGENNEISYSENLLVGYRWNDAKQVAPLFPFGHGLSYSSFKYTNLKIDVDRDVSGVLHSVHVSVDVTNEGPLQGAEVVQLYLEYPLSAGEPPKQLRGFQKTLIRVGATATVNLSMHKRDWSIYDITIDDWAVHKGTYSVHIGASSRDIRLVGQFVV